MTKEERKIFMKAMQFALSKVMGEKTIPAAIKKLQAEIKRIKEQGR